MAFCIKCGSSDINSNGICSNCGYQNSDFFGINDDENSNSESPKISEEEYNNPECFESSEEKSDASKLDETNSNALNGWQWGAIFLSIASVASFIMGFYKLLFYDNGEYYPYKFVNSYVGGDAYNYIINGTYATAYFVLGGALLISALLMIVINNTRREK